jgi:hypothetical protein
VLFKFKISLILPFLSLIFFCSEINAQATLMRFDKRLAIWENFTFKDTANGNINLVDNENHKKYYSTKLFLGAFTTNGSFLLLHDSTYLVRKAPIDFYKKNLKSFVINSKGNKFYYDELKLNRKYAHNTFLLLNDELIRKTVRKYNSLTILKSFFITTMIPGITAPFIIYMGHVFADQVLIDIGVIEAVASVVSIGSVILINKKQRKLNKKMVERYNSLLLQP